MLSEGLCQMQWNASPPVFLYTSLSVTLIFDHDLISLSPSEFDEILSGIPEMLHSNKNLKHPPTSRGIKTKQTVEEATLILLVYTACEYNPA